MARWKVRSSKAPESQRNTGVCRGRRSWRWSRSRGAELEGLVVGEGEVDDGALGAVLGEGDGEERVDGAGHGDCDGGRGGSGRGGSGGKRERRSGRGEVGDWEWQGRREPRHRGDLSTSTPVSGSGGDRAL